MRRVLRNSARLLALIALSALALQLYFLARVALMAVVDPQSTSLQRTEAFRLLVGPRPFNWSQRWVDDGRISRQLKLAVIASEDAGFTEHSGVEWDAIERAWERNQRAEARFERLSRQLAAGGSAASPSARTVRAPKVVGGSTITQQLAKNLFLSSERTMARKAQEFVVTLMLEGLLDKGRILEIYLNSVEWGEGVFGAEAAARHYFKTGADRLGTQSAARLAVMLPAPKRFEKRPGSAYIAGRAAAVAARMRNVELP